VRTPRPSTDGSNLMSHRRRFGRSTCFLCGSPLRSKNRTDEHVFPKWLQSRFHLWTNRLNLLNRTDILYKSLLIPCCKRCNTVHLSLIENKVRDAVIAGPNAVRALNPLIVYLWMGKIFYGLLYLEHLLPGDRTRKSKPILPRDVLEELETHHLYLQGTRKPLVCPFGIPGSVFVFGTQQPDRIGLQFDFIDNQPLRCMAIRMGSVGIACVFHDAGIIRSFHDSLGDEAYSNRILHPFQFREIVAMIAYKTRLLKTSPSFLMMESPEAINVIATRPSDIHFDEWITEDFCYWLSFFHEQPLDELFNPPNKFISYLNEPDGSFRDLDANTRYTFTLR
jgi:hypothetical protein